MKSLKINLKPMLKRLEVTSKRGLFGELTGEYRSAFKGKGFEFSGFRKYMPSDDASQIDWKTSLRSQDLVIRQYQDERNLEILFVFDVSSSMSFASQDKLKCEFAAELIASLAFVMLEVGDSVGLLMFTDKITKFLRPDIGPKCFYKLSRALSDPKNYDGKKDIIKILKYLGSSIKQNTVIILVSDFIGFSDGWEVFLEQISKRSEVIGFMVRDPYDLILPSVGQVTISDPFSEKEILLDTDRFKNLYEIETLRQIDHIRASFLKTKSDVVLITTDRPYQKPVLDFFFRRKQRCK